MGDLMMNWARLEVEYMKNKIIEVEEFKNLLKDVNLEVPWIEEVFVEGIIQTLAVFACILAVMLDLPSIAGSEPLNIIQSGGVVPCK